MRLARLFCVTDARLARGDLPDVAEGLSRAGVDLLQLRDDKASDAEKLTALEQLRAAAQPNGLVSVYADYHLAQEFGADVLHLPKGRPTAAKARGYVSEWAQLGRSCYSADEIDAALVDDGIAFLTVGPMVGRIPWRGAQPGLDLVRHAAKVAPPARPGSKPWFAIGGITLDNLDQVLDAGARRVAVGRAIVDADDPAAAAGRFSDRLRAAWGDEFESFTLGALSSGGFRSVAGAAPAPGEGLSMPAAQSGAGADDDSGEADDLPPARSAGADDPEACDLDGH